MENTALTFSDFCHLYVSFTSFRRDLQIKKKSAKIFLTNFSQDQMILYSHPEKHIIDKVDT